MSDAHQSDKAKGASISFNPYSLYEWAEAYGNSCDPKLSPSAVMCNALREFKARVEPEDTLEAQVVAAARRLGFPKALEALVSHRATAKRKR